MSVLSAIKSLGPTLNRYRRKASMFALTGQWQDMTGSRLRKTRAKVQGSQDYTLDLGVRENMISAARTLCQIHGIGRSILRSYSHYTVGSCAPKWATSDEAWNDETNEASKLWMSQCHARGQHDLKTLVQLAVKSMVRDGDLLVEKMTVEGLPVVDLIEADRVTANVSGMNVDDDKRIGGIAHDDAGRAIAYHVCERTQYGSFKNPRIIPATSVLHVFDTDRVDSVRGVTHFAAAIHNIFDFEETFEAEKAAQKTASKIALIIRNSLGRPDEFNPLLGSDTNSNGSVVSTENIGDAAIKYQMHGDQLEALKSERPGNGWFQMCEMIVRQISISLGLPYEFVWNMSGLAGPSVRMTTKLADRNFKHTMGIVESRLLGPLFAWWVNVEMNAGRIPFNSEWMRFSFKRPVMASIDAQRESTADLNEWNAGLKSGQDICEQVGEDVYEIQEQKAREYQHALQLSERFGVPVEAITINAATVAGMQAKAVQEAAESASEDSMGEDTTEDKAGKKAPANGAPMEEDEE